MNKFASHFSLCFILFFSASSCLIKNEQAFIKNEQQNLLIADSDTIIDQTINNKVTDSVTLLFIGDVMGHDSQIESAFDKDKKTHDYKPVFKNVESIIKKADFAIANLEVTLAGKPYKGYPQFSSPDELAIACKESGIDVLVTANNHSCDRRKKGLLRTKKILDSLKIPHTGTFKDLDDRKKKNLLVLEKNNIKIGILNYTYGTNGIPATKPTIVNLIDTSLIFSDINNSKKDSLDKLVVFLHWGKEYESHPSSKQVQLAQMIIDKGADIIIGSHPHVLQRMEFINDTTIDKEYVISYSLGNFVSAQRTRKRDGGAMLEIKILKEDSKSIIKSCGYHLTWVNITNDQNKKKFEIIPVINKEQFKLNEKQKNKLDVFIDDSRKLLEKENINVKEIKN